MLISSPPQPILRGAWSTIPFWGWYPVKRSSNGSFVVSMLHFNSAFTPGTILVLDVLDRENFFSDLGGANNWDDKKCVGNILIFMLPSNVYGVTLQLFLDKQLR